MPGHGDYYYWLEDVDAAGHGAFHGPVSVTIGNNPTAVATSALASTPAPAWGGLLVLGTVLNAMRICKP